jgi:hypothetical protein
LATIDGRLGFCIKVVSGLGMPGSIGSIAGSASDVVDATVISVLGLETG